MHLSAVSVCQFTSLVARIDDDEDATGRKSSCSAGRAMAFTLWALLEAALLVLNSVCILHEQRFLAKCEFFPNSSR